MSLLLLVFLSRTLSKSRNKTAASPEIPQASVSAVRSTSRKSRASTSGTQLQKSSQKTRNETTVSKSKRYRPGTRALKEIRHHYQKSTDLLISRASSSRLVKEIFVELGAIDYRVQVLAMEALQEAAKLFLICLMEKIKLCELHAMREIIRYDLWLKDQK